MCFKELYFVVFRTIAALWHVTTLRRKTRKWLQLPLLPLRILLSYRSLELAFMFTSDPVFHQRERKGKVKIANRKRKQVFSLCLGLLPLLTEEKFLTFIVCVEVEVQTRVCVVYLKLLSFYAYREKVNGKNKKKTSPLLLPYRRQKKLVC